MAELTLVYLQLSQQLTEAPLTLLLNRHYLSFPQHNRYNHGARYSRLQLTASKPTSAN